MADLDATAGSAPKGRHHELMEIETAIVRYLGLDTWPGLIGDVRRSARFRLSVRPPARTDPGPAAAC